MELSKETVAIEIKRCSLNKKHYKLKNVQASAKIATLEDSLKDEKDDLVKAEIEAEIAILKHDLDVNTFNASILENHEKHLMKSYEALSANIVSPNLNALAPPPQIQKN